MTSKIKNTTVLARIDFPLYSIQFLTCRHILVAGGGGSSKTGVSNEFKCFELFYNNGEVSAQEVLSYETGSYAVSNFAVITKSKHVYIVAGLESRSQLYRIKYSIRSEGDNISHELKNGENPSDILKSRKNKFEDKNHSFNGLASKKLITFQILPENVIQTDFHPEEPDQKVVRVSPKNNLIATGGADGHVRIWEFPFLKLKLDIAAHKDEIDDLDFDLTGTQVVSISKDRTGVIWDVSTGNKIHDLKWTPPNGTKYLYRRCRFSVLEGDPNAHCIFMITNLNDKRTGKIQLWNSKRGVLLKQNDFKENLSALAVRNDGRFVAVGTMVTGTVLLLTSFNLQIVLQIPNAHGAFITGLQFIPVSKSDDDSFTTMSEASVISISVDRKICIHSLPYRDTMSVWILVIMVFFIIIITFTICSFVGL